MFSLLLVVSLALAAEKGPVRESALESCRAMSRQRERELPIAEAGSVDRVAVVVGVSCYAETEAFGTLLAPTNDAREVSELLVQAGFEQVLLTGWVSGEEVRESLERALELVSEDGILLLYWSGHGALDRPGRLPERHLITSDTTLPWISLTALATDDLEEILASARAARRVLVVDSCHAATLVSKAVQGALPESDPLTLVPQGTRGEPADLRLYASDFGRPAFEESDPDDERFGHSLYTWHLVRAFDSAAADLDGDGSVGLWESHEFAARKVRASTSGVQNPRMEALAPDNIQLFDDGRPRAPHSAVVVHLGQLGSRVRLDVDGGELAFGAVSPGRRLLEVSRIEPVSGATGDVAPRLLWSHRVVLQPGEWLAVDRLVAERERRWLGTIGFAWSQAMLAHEQPSRSVVFSGWLLPADPRGLRPALGLSARAGVDTLYVDQTRMPSGGLGLRGGAMASWGLDPQLSFGPTLDLSWLVRAERHSDGVEERDRLRSVPVLGPSLHLQLRVRELVLSADGGLGVMPYGPAAGSGLEWGLRRDVSVSAGWSW